MKTRDQGDPLKNRKSLSNPWGPFHLYGNGNSLDDISEKYKDIDLNDFMFDKLMSLNPLTGECAMDCCFCIKYLREAKALEYAETIQNVFYKTESMEIKLFAASYLTLIRENEISKLSKDFIKKSLYRSDVTSGGWVLVDERSMTLSYTDDFTISYGVFVEIVEFLDSSDRKWALRYIYEANGLMRKYVLNKIVKNNEPQDANLLYNCYRKSGSYDDECRILSLAGLLKLSFENRCHITDMEEEISVLHDKIINDRELVKLWNVYMPDRLLIAIE